MQNRVNFGKQLCENWSNVRDFTRL